MRFILRLLTITLFLLGGVGTVSAQVKPPQEPAIEQLKKTVVFLEGTYVVTDNRVGENAPQRVFKRLDGTGFIISVAEPRLGPNAAMLFLVTNKHLIREPSPLGDVGEGPFFEKLFLRINTKLPNTDGKQYQMVEIPVVDDTGSLVPFISSQEGNVDLALTPIRPDANKLDFRTIPDSLFATSKLLNDKGVNENDEVLFTGLFAWNPGAKKNYPIVRHGKVARLFEEPIPWDKRYPDKLVDVHLADVMSFGGNSGSPVFLRIGGVRDAGVAPFVSTGYSYYLLGVMQGYFPGDIASQNSGIAAIIPADKILHILDSPRARAYRERFVAGTNVQRGNLEAAAESYRKAITILEESAPQHSDLAGTLQGYARLLRRLNRIHEADAVDERAKLLRRGTTRDRMNPRF